ncbi:SDR family oxidoreductase [Asticcacaulis sp. SL142]|uniref:SDR family oxidoreductase n=1 Tax=Asticcacaulis sp. SL142 TaxID=2995155 RepID=UPI00226CE509|nr:SDR family oxidoreductase [Asticcacaulis sp. SL142]WAC48033.1 SDR family oxidoreductase [Asticcacaulis sp. SL142]
MTTQNIALVLGATGGIGGEMARTLLARGWQVRALHRTRSGKDEGIDWIKGDAMIASDVRAAAQGVAVIVHAVNPPGYKNWGKLVLPMIDNTIEAARATGARIILPGTVYNFGPDVLPNILETSTQNPITAKGKIRAEMERRLRMASQHGLKVLIVRAGDFFGPSAGNSWFAQAMAKPGAPVTAITYPGKKGVGHQWTYLPDMAETVMRLIETDALEPFSVFHMKGHWDADGTQMIAAIRRVVGKPNLPVKKFPWKLMKLLVPFVVMFRELREMRYLWKVPVYMSNDRLVAALGAEPHTPLDQAVRSALIGQGCLRE